MNIKIAKPQLNHASETPSKAEQHLLSVLKKEIVNPKSAIRSFLTGDALTFLKDLLLRADKDGGELYMAIYELHDPELIDLLEQQAKKKRIYIILSTASSKDPTQRARRRTRKSR